MARNLGPVAEQVGRFPWLVTLAQDLRGHRAGEIVGCTSFFDCSILDERVEIGYTAYASWAWGSEVNPECKLLLMSWAFEVAEAGRVQLKTDIRNTRSQEAIARLGAVREGVLRRHQRRQDGTIRDSVMYSVIREEWPAVREGLEERLGR
jgi:RimJ/RimL family protein N-acetyltransferase